MPPEVLSLEAAFAHIDPAVLSKVLTELDWTPHAELRMLVAIVNDDKSGARHKIGAAQLIRNRIIESLELTGCLAHYQAKFRGLLPAEGNQVEKSPYLEGDTPAQADDMISKISTERELPPAAAQPDPPQGGVNPQEGEQTTDGERRPPQPDSDRSGEGSERCDGLGLPLPSSTGEHGHSSPSQPGGSPESSRNPYDDRRPPEDRKEAEADRLERAEPESDRFRLRRQSTPVFGKPIGRRPPTKPTLGGGICGPAHGS